MIWVFSWCPLLKSKFLRKMDVKISLAVSLALNQILTGEPDTSFPDELRSTLRWTSPAGRQTERNYRLPNATGYKTRGRKNTPGTRTCHVGTSERVPVQFRLLLERCLEKDLTTWLGRLAGNGAFCVAGKFTSALPTTPVLSVRSYREGCPPS